MTDPVDVVKHYFGFRGLRLPEYDALALVAALSERFILVPKEDYAALVERAERAQASALERGREIQTLKDRLRWAEGPLPDGLLALAVEQLRGAGVDVGWVRQDDFEDWTPSEGTDSDERRLRIRGLAPERRDRQR